MPRILFWSLFGLTFAIYGLMLAWSLPTIAAAANGLTPFDMRPGGYTLADAQAFLSALSADGADFYRNTQQRLDLFYPGLLALTLFFAIAALLPKRLGNWRYALALVALPVGGFDYLENHAIAQMIDAGATGLTADLVVTASQWTILKSYASIVAESVVLLLLIWRLGQWLAPRVTAVLRKRPLLSFIVLALVTSAAVQAIGFALGLSMFVLSSLGVCVGLVGPALLVTAVEGGPTAIRDLLKRTLLRPVSIGWLSAAAFGLVIVLLASAVLLRCTAPLAQFSQTWPGLFTSYIPDLLLTFFAIQLGEEFAWTGFLQQRLQNRHSTLRATLIVAPIFALSHLVINWLGSGELVAALAMLGVQLVFALFFRAIITTLFNLTGSILVPAMFHAAFNTANGTFVKGLIGPDAMWMLLVAIALAALLALALTRGRLGQGRGEPMALPHLQPA